MENKFENRSYEKKYYVESPAAFDRIVEVLNLAPSYIVAKTRSAKNVDIYYDTPDKFLNSFNASIRSRKNGENQYLSIKYKNRAFIDKTFVDTIKEYSKEIPYDENFIDNPDSLLYLDDKIREVYSFRIDVDILRLLGNLKPFLVVESVRNCYEMKNNENFECEVYMDTVYFSGKRKKYTDYIVEIKLTCVAAKNNIETFDRFIKYLNKRTTLIPMEETKYEEGLRSLKFTDKRENKKPEDDNEDEGNS